MRVLLTWLISSLLVIAGLVLVLQGSPVEGAAVLFAGAGLWMADFRFAKIDGRRRLTAAGTPALLLLPLLLGGAQLSVTSLSMLPYGFARTAVDECPVEDSGRLKRPVWIGLVQE